MKIGKYTQSEWVSVPCRAEHAGKGSFFQQKTAQRSKVVQNPAACRDMVGKLAQIEPDDLQSLLPPRRAFLSGKRNVGFNLCECFRNRFRQKQHIPV